MNSDFWVTRDAICANDFHSWLRHSWKLLANRLTRDPKIVTHGNSCIILYISNALAMEILQSCTKPSIWWTLSPRIFNSWRTRVRHIARSVRGLSRSDSIACNIWLQYSKVSCWRWLQCVFSRFLMSRRNCLKMLSRWHIVALASQRRRSIVNCCRIPQRLLSTV